MRRKTMMGAALAALLGIVPGGTKAQADGPAGRSPLRPLMDEHWAMVLEEDPTFATTIGVRAHDDELGDPSLAAYEAGIERRQGLLSRLAALSPDELSEDERLNRELLMLELAGEVEAAQYGGKYLTISTYSSPVQSLTSLPDRLPFRTPADYRSYVTRLGAVPRYLQAAADRLAEGVEAGWVQPCAPMEGFEDVIAFHLVDDPADSVFLAPFTARPQAVPEDAFEALRAEAAETVGGGVVPALAEFAAFYDEVYRPACRPEVGVGGLPGGADYYAQRVRTYTTLPDATPEGVHETGLREVARIRARMEEIAEAEGFETLAAFQEHLRTSPEYYPETPEERIAAASVIGKRMDGKLVELFTVLPRTPWDIRAIPDDIAEKTTTAYYSQPAGDGSRPGTYWVNLSKLDTRPLHELEALTLHEAVPGHHLQIALSQEMDLAPFRRFGGFTAFVEGWGLYAESLGEEVGFYRTPLTKFGQLSYEQWRACRLVVDTGMHAKGWSRQQAIDFMAQNTGLSMNNIVTEVDRYITWPGQALAYKTGELKLKELRARAEAALGEDFDLRLFHDAVLENGAVPLSVLERHVDEWVRGQKA